MFSTPVDVSACTTATTRASGCSRCASSRRCGSSGRPHSSSIFTTSAPLRRATSHMRSPNTPLAPTITVSPGSTTLTKHASIPAEPVPLTGKVSSLVVPNTVRRRAIVSSMIPMNSGSMCPSSGRPNAATASGYGFDGPGPSSNRSEITIPRTYRGPAAPFSSTSRHRVASDGEPISPSERAVCPKKPTLAPALASALASAQARIFSRAPPRDARPGSGPAEPFTGTPEPRSH